MLRRGLDQAGPHGVVIDILGDAVHILSPAQDVVIITFLPKPLPQRSSVVVAGHLFKGLHELDQVSAGCFDQQVEVIGHEAVGEDIHAVLAGDLR